MSDEISRKLKKIFSRLHNHFGPLHWWPAETPFEVAIGAILTQNTTWSNVEKAIQNLRKAQALTPVALAHLSRSGLEAHIYPAGFFRQKAERLQIFASYICEHHEGQIESLLAGNLGEVRTHLLTFKGIGPETADSILLYAGERLSFVIDAYTLRLFTRMGLLQGNENYQTAHAFFMVNLEPKVKFYNEYHALIVEQCKQFCRKRNPDCYSCLLRTDCLRKGIPK